jgi:dihydrofolate synthase/folylpolyglutamate synthase
MAFDYFAQEEVDIAIIETGLGGRLDSTNVILPEACLITNIGLDHTDMLGNTLSQIAAEKAGIIKDLTPVVIGEHQGDISYVFESRANAKSADLYYARSLVEEEDLFQTDLLGSYQRKNVRSTMALLNIMLKLGWSLEQDKVRHGYANVASLTGLKGRWQVVSESPKVICDTGHNTEGMTELMRQLKREKYNRLHIVFGQVSGKDSKQILRLLPKDASYYFCQPGVIRALSVHELNKAAEDVGLEGYVYETVSGAYQAAQEKASEEDVIFVGGSTFVVADFLATLV